MWKKIIRLKKACVPETLKPEQTKVLWVHSNKLQLCKNTVPISQNSNQWNMATFVFVFESNNIGKRLEKILDVIQRFQNKSWLIDWLKKRRRQAPSFLLQKLKWVQFEFPFESAVGMSSLSVLWLRYDIDVCPLAQRRGIQWRQPALLSFSCHPCSTVSCGSVWPLLKHSDCQQRSA